MIPDFATEGFLLRPWVMVMVADEAKLQKEAATGSEANEDFDKIAAREAGTSPAAGLVG